MKTSITSALLMLTGLLSARTVAAPCSGEACSAPPAQGESAAVATRTRADRIEQARAFLPRDESRVEYDAPRAGALYARGARYKMGFDERGATYYPLFGSSYAHAPHALSPDVVSVGGTPIPFDHAALARRVEDRVEIDRGAFREVYDLGPTEVEQSFVFDALPGGGDVVVHIPVATSLAPRATSAALEFHGQGGHVSYGRAVAIDAAGRRASAATEFSQGSITLRVDRAFAAGAELPLVIDPVIATFPISWLATDEVADVAVDAASGNWLVVFEQAPASNDRDVYAVTLNPDGSPRSFGYIDNSPNVWDSARCANGSPDQFLVVARVDEIPNVWNIRARRVTGSTLTVGPELTISEFSEGDCNEPVVGGDATDGGPTNNVYLVVYKRGIGASSGDIVHRRVTSAVVAAPVVIATTWGYVDPEPEISKSCTFYEWLVTWKDAVLATDPATIKARRVHWGGSLLGTAFDVSSSSSFTSTHSVSSALVQPSGTATFVAASTQLIGGTPHVELAAVRGGVVLQTLDLGSALGLAGIQRGPSVDTNGAHFTVVYEHSDASGSYRLATEVAVAGDTLAIVAHDSLGSVASPVPLPRIAAYRHREQFGGTHDLRYAIVWVYANFAVSGALYEGVHGGPKTPFCFGDGSGTACPCGNASAPGAQAGCTNSYGTPGRLVATGDASTVYDTLVLQVTGLPPTGNAPTFFQGTLQANGGSGTVFGDGLRCVVGSIQRLGGPPSSAGSASIGYGVPGTELVSVRGALPPTGGTRFYQVSYRNAAAFCSPATFNASNGLVVTWTP